MQLCNETKFAVAMDLHGRMIVPDAELTAIELLAAPSSEEVETLSKQLQRQLLDYRSPMAAPRGSSDACRGRIGSPFYRGWSSAPPGAGPPSSAARRSLGILAAERTFV